MAFAYAPALPALHGVQAGAAAAEEKLPALHSVHSVDLAAEVDPAAQGAQPAALETAPGAVPNLPAAQEMQAGEPGADCQDPAAHWLQLLAPLGEKEPARQDVHCVLLANDENLPALQARQAPRE